MVQPMPSVWYWDVPTAASWRRRTVTTGTMLQVGQSATILPGASWQVGSVVAAPRGDEAATAGSAATLSPPTLLDLAAAATAEGRPKVAVEALRREVRERGEQAGTLRLLAVALAMDDQWKEAAAAIRSAYRQDPKLATTPMDALGAGLEDRPLRALLKRAVHAANRSKGASEWLLVAALMQAEGRVALASTMATRAANAGLEPEIAAGFVQAAGISADRATDGRSDRK